jgi:hypothetical protein
LNNSRWVPPPGWPRPPEGWSPPPDWEPDPAWGPPPTGWVWWQPAERVYPPLWQARSVADTSPRFKKRLAAAFAVIVLLFALGAVSDSGSPDVATTAADSEQKPPLASPESATPSPRPTAAPAAPSPIPTPVPVAPPTTDELIDQAGQDHSKALALLGTLAVKGRAPKTGYDRDLFGAAWTDTDRNGCDTRNDILARDLAGETFKAGTKDCVVMTGTLADPYTGTTINFTKADAKAVHIDHVVALSDAWQKGAQQWEPGKRLAFANDPLNLLAVDGPANSSKSDGDAATWLPPNKGYRCAMVARQVAVKAKYGASVTAAERDAIGRVLSACPDEPAPQGGNPTMAPVAPPKAAAPPQKTQAPAEPNPPPPPPPAGAKEYQNCTELRKDYKGGVARPGAVDKRASGSAKYKPHYDQALYDANRKSDRDKDGIACEQ